MKIYCGMNLEDWKEVKHLESKEALYGFDMNKVCDSEDEVNNIKRQSRDATDRGIMKPWQNEIMARFLLLLFEEMGDTVLYKHTVLNKYNESGVPLTWARLVLTKVQYEKKTAFPPWNPERKVTVVLPLKTPE